MVAGKVRLELVKQEGEMLGIIADDLDADSGSHPWKAGKYGINQTAPAGAYRVRVRSQNNILISDESDQTFQLRSLASSMHKIPAGILKKPDLVMCTEMAVYVPLKTLGWFHVYVRNVGKGTAKAPFDVEIFFAGHSPFRRTMDSDLGPGETCYVMQIADSKISTYTIGFQVRADPDNDVAETNEENNLSSGVLYIEEGNPQSSSPILCGDGSTVQTN